MYLFYYYFQRNNCFSPFIQPAGANFHHHYTPNHLFSVIYLPTLKSSSTLLLSTKQLWYSYYKLAIIKICFVAISKHFNIKWTNFSTIFTAAKRWPKLQWVWGKRNRNNAMSGLGKRNRNIHINRSQLISILLHIKIRKMYSNIIALLMWHT